MNISQTNNAIWVFWKCVPIFTLATQASVELSTSTPDLPSSSVASLSESNQLLSQIPKYQDHHQYQGNLKSSPLHPLLPQLLDLSPSPQLPPQ